MEYVIQPGLHTLVACIDRIRYKPDRSIAKGNAHTAGMVAACRNENIVLFDGVLFMGNIRAIGRQGRKKLCVYRSGISPSSAYDAVRGIVVRVIMLSGKCSTRECFTSFGCQRKCPHHQRRIVGNTKGNIPFNPISSMGISDFRFGKHKRIARTIGNTRERWLESVSCRTKQPSRCQSAAAITGTDVVSPDDVKVSGTNTVTGPAQIRETLACCRGTNQRRNVFSPRHSIGDVILRNRFPDAPGSCGTAFTGSRFVWIIFQNCRNERVQRLLLEEGKDRRDVTDNGSWPPFVGGKAVAKLLGIACRREDAMGIDVIMLCECDLFEVIGALHSSGGFSSGLHGGQKECDEHADDGNDDKEFDERKTSFASGVGERFVFH